MKRLISATLTGLALIVLMAMPILANHSGDRNCDDFDSQAQAQRFFNNHGGSPSNNVDDLDRNNNGETCENNDYGSGGSGSGGATGNGSGRDDDGGDAGEMPDTATFGTDPVNGLPLLLMVLGLWTFGLMLRRRVGVRL